MDENNQPQPALCDTYDVSDDKLTYTFHLRDGIQWSNGDPVKAGDFVFSWLKQMSAEATNGLWKFSLKTRHHISQTCVQWQCSSL